MALSFTQYASACQILADNRLDVVAAPTATHGLAWLRGAVSRFSRGGTHARRRELAAHALLAVRPDELRAAAVRLARGHAPSTPPRDVPLAVLAQALGVRRPVQDQVALITPGYFERPGGAGQSDVDDAVDELVEAFGGDRDEATAARIGLLVQAHDATGGLVANALAALRLWQPAGTVAAVVAETLRHDPPVPVLRRQALVDLESVDGHPILAGTIVAVDVATANRDPAVFADPDRFDAGRHNLDRVLTFGAGLRPCPGRDHAMALATGTVEGTLRGPGSGTCGGGEDPGELDRLAGHRPMA